ncbi:MAG: ABC transporter permease [Bacillota bacterium]
MALEAVKPGRITIEKGFSPSPFMQVLVPLIAVILALAVCGLFLLFSGQDPFTAYSKMFFGVIGTSYGMTETILKAIPLMIAGLGLGLAFRMRLWNIGGEGQLHMGAFAATGVALFMPDYPIWVVLPLMFLAACFAGGVWALLCAVPRAYLGVNETITTLMLNYVAIFWVDYLVYGPWKDPEGFNFPLTATFSESATLPALAGSRIHCGLIIGLIMAVILYVVIYKTKWGYEIRVIGESESAARYAGMNIRRQIILVMFVSGALCGLAGMSEVSGLVHRLRPGFSPGYGYTAIIVAWLANLNPLATVVVAVLFGALETGGYIIQTSGISANLVSVIQGTLLFFVLGGEILVRYRIRLAKPAVSSGEDSA